MVISSKIKFLIAYFILLAVDLGANAIAIFVPTFGAIAETLNEIVIEIASAVIVVILAFGKGK